MDAPQPPADLAERVIAAARSRWRRRAVVGTCVAAAAIGIAVPVALPDSSGHGTDAAVVSVSPAARRTAVHGGAPTAAPRYSTGAQIYAAVLLYRLGVDPHQDTQPLHALDHTCADVLDPMRTARCPGTPIRAAVQHQVRQLIGPRLSFVSAVDRSTAHPGVPERDAGSYFTFGRLAVHGRRARAPVEVYCGFDCVAGTTLVLRHRRGTWIVTGTTGNTYIA